jgi:hypothetical protein
VAGVAWRRKAARPGCLGRAPGDDWTALQPQLAMTETRRGSPREARDEGGDAGVVRCHEATHLHRLGRARQPLDDREDENEPRINDMTTSDEFDDGNSPASS